MKKEDCIAIAKSIEVRALETSDGGLGGLVEPLRTFHMSEIQLQKFAKLVEQATIERAAKICEDISDEYARTESRRYPELKTDAETGASDCEDAIRALKDSNE